MGCASAPENLYHQPRGEYAHRYSENMYGDSYPSYGQYSRVDGEAIQEYRHFGRRRGENTWDQNPGGGSYGYNHYSTYMDTNSRGDNGWDDRSSANFRARNARYRDRVRGYKRRRDYNFDIDRENLFREYGSVDEHLNQSMRGARYDHW